LTWRGLISLVCLLALTVFAGAQSDDRGLLQRTLEDALSGEDRTVEIIGFAGALSSVASVEEIRVSDANGLWLQLTDVELDWRRAALFQGRVVVNALTAAEIDLSRLPTPSAEAPSPEASGFELPDLPVSVEIGEVSTAKLILGRSVLGIATEMSVTGALSLIDGAGTADIRAERIDGTRGLFDVEASYAPTDRRLTTNITLSEAPGGIASTLIGLPGNPSVDLSITGDAPLAEFAADLNLRTDGQDRLAGTVTLGTGAEADGAPTQTFSADIGGDVAPLFLPEYQAFFGRDVALTVRGTRFADGRLTLSDLSLNAAAITLSGDLSLGSDNVPSFIDLTGRIGFASGEPVLLPISGDPTTVQSADLSVKLDAAAGDAWTADVVVGGLERPDLRAARVSLNGGGTIDRDGLAAEAIEAAFDFAAEDLDLTSVAAEEALGEAVIGNAEIALRRDAPVTLRQFDIRGESYAASAAGTVEIVGRDLSVDGRASVEAQDLSVFAGLAGRPLSGAAQIEAEGAGTVLGGSASVEATISSQDLAIGLAELDAMTEGDATLRVEVFRDETGTGLKALQIESDHAEITGSGFIASDRGEVQVTAQVRDLSRVRDALSGPGSVQVSATAPAPIGPWTGTARATAFDSSVSVDGALRIEEPASFEGAASADISDLSRFAALLDRPLTGAIVGDVSGRLSLDLNDIDAGVDLTGRNLRVGIAYVDQLLDGDITLNGQLEKSGDEIAVSDFALSGTTLSANGTARVGGDDGEIDVQARLSDVSRFVSGLSGPLTAEVQATQSGGSWNVDASATGPGGSSADIGGQVAADASSANVDITGRASLLLASRFIEPRTLEGDLRFDLGLNGPLQLSSLSGTLTANGARFADPAQGLALDGIDTRVEMAGSSANVTLSGQVRGGGSISVQGPVALTAPNAANLQIDLRNVAITDPELYTTTASGNLTIDGPVTGGALIAGRIALGTTEIRVPTSTATGVSSIPEIQHIGEPATSRATRARAGLIGEDAAGGGDGPVFPLDIRVDALNRMFIRGRGLDAELGGSLRVAGTTADIAPDGQFDLIRGRLDILGRRLTLTEGRAQLIGDLDPDIFLVAETNAEEVTVRIVVSGKASAPEISFLSEPELPEDEVLARLLFGRGIENLSALQAAQLVSAVATLSGRGGGGVISRIRESTGLDDLDVTTDETGQTSLRVGRYLSDNVYTDATVGGDGEAEINLNLDVTNTITLRGSVSTTGSTGLGVFIERDY